MADFYCHNAQSIKDYEPMKKAKADAKYILDKMKEEIKDIKDIQYTGSAYEDTKAKNQPPELDVMLVKEEKDTVMKGVDGCNSHKERCIDGKPVSAIKEQQKMYGGIQKFLNKNPELKERVTLRSHGPAVQLDVKETASSEKPPYSMDLVLAQKSGDKLFVAKPLENRENTWRCSHSLKEKDFMLQKDQEAAGRRSALREAKALRNHDPTLQTLSTYCYKNAAMNLSDTKKDWSSGEKYNMGQVRDLLSHMSASIDEHNLPVHFDRSVNLLDGKSNDQLNPVARRLENLSNPNSKELEKLMEKGVPKDYHCDGK